MTSEREQLVALRRDAEEQRGRFGRKRVSLRWWPNADQPFFSRGSFTFLGDPFEWTSEYAKEIRGSDLLYPPHDAWGHDRRVPGAVIFDPHDDQTEALDVFRELARRVGEFLELQRPDLCENELKPLICSTHPAVKARDWTLAWIFRRQFNDCDDEPNFRGELTDAFGLLVECIDKELATVSRESPSPKPHVCASIGKRTVWADILISDSVEPRCADGPLKPDGFCLNGIEVWGLAEDWHDVLAFVWKHRGDPRKWEDVATHLGVLEEMTAAGFRKFINKINKKLKDYWPETLQTVTRKSEGTFVVLRMPTRKKVAKRKNKSRTAKAAAAPKSTRNQRATTKRH